MERLSGIKIIYIYILAAILGMILFTPLRAFAGETEYAYLWANGGKFPNGTYVAHGTHYLGRLTEANTNNPHYNDWVCVTVTGLNDDSERYYSADWPTMDGATFVGYVYDSAFSTMDPKAWDAIYKYQHGIQDTVTFKAGTSYATYWKRNDEGYVSDWSSSSVYDTTVTVDTKTGKYTYETERGYSTYTGRGTLENIIKQANENKYKITLSGYAIWSKPYGYTIKFNVNGGSKTISSQTVSEITLPDPGTRNGYTFAGWYNGNTRVGGAGSKWKPTANVTLTAKWTPITYSINYVLNGGTNNSSNKSSYNIETATFSLNAPSRTGYTFEGWYSDAGLTKKVTSVAKGSTGNKTFYAKWKTITYTITYKLNGGKMDYKKAKYNIETPTFYIENPTKKGYNFTGWTGTGIDTADTDLSVPLGSYGNKTFEATWGKGVYTISFDGNGATTGEMDTITVESDESIKLPENSFVREGYSFVGWYTTKEDRFGTFYKNGATVSDLTESVTLHAQWKKEKETVVPGENGNNGTGNAGDNNGTGDNGSGTGNGGSTGDNGSGSGNNSGNSGTGDGNGDNNGSGDNGSGTGNGGSTGGNGNGGNGSGSGNGNGDNNGSGSNGSGTGNGDSTGDNGNGGNGSGSGNGSGNSGSGNGNGDNNGSGNNGSGIDNGGSAGDNGNGGNGSGSGNGSGNSGSGDGNGDNNGSGNKGNDSGRGGNNGKNVPVVTTKDEIGYFGTAQRRNEISIRTTLGMQDNKLTLNYNY